MLFKILCECFDTRTVQLCLFFPPELGNGFNWNFNWNCLFVHEQSCSLLLKRSFMRKSSWSKGQHYANPTQTPREKNEMWGENRSNNNKVKFFFPCFFFLFCTKKCHMVCINHKKLYVSCGKLKGETAAAKKIHNIKSAVIWSCSRHVVHIHKKKRPVTNLSHRATMHR